MREKLYYPNSSINLNSNYYLTLKLMLNLAIHVFSNHFVQSSALAVAREKNERLPLPIWIKIKKTILLKIKWLHLLMCKDVLTN